MTEPAQRRDEAMNRRRLELGMTWRQVASAAGVSYETLRAVRKGDTTGGELTLSSIERALRWAPSAFAAIDSGGKPALAETEPTATPTRPLLSREEEILRGVIAVTAEKLGLSPEEADEAYRSARDDLARRLASESRPAATQEAAAEGTRHPHAM